VRSVAAGAEWVEAVIEIPRGSTNKYEYDHHRDVLLLDRHLFSATTYPADYGFVPDTLAEDGDPLDVLVILEEATFPGCHIRARPIGMFTMRDEHGPDCKIVAVPFGDPRWEPVRDLDGLPPGLTAEIGHFFDVYKDLDFRSYAATSSQARRMMPISCGVTGSGSARRNCAVMITRRSLKSMSRTEGWAFCRYQGAMTRAASTSPG